MRVGRPGQGGLESIPETRGEGSPRPPSKDSDNDTVGQFLPGGKFNTGALTKSGFHSQFSGAGTSKKDPIKKLGTINVSSMARPGVEDASEQ